MDILATKHPRKEFHIYLKLPYHPKFNENLVEM